MPRQADRTLTTSKVIQPGDSGIWATCDKGRERKCIGELQDLFAEYAELLYGHAELDDAKDGAPTSAGIESEIQAEIDDIHHPQVVQLFTPCRVDVQCG